MDRKRLLQTLGGCYAYYERELTPMAIRVWEEDMAGLDPDAIDAAFTRHRRDPERGQFLPKTADILRQVRGDVEESALVAWGEVLAAAKDGGRRFDGVSGRALDSIGGMTRVRMSKPDEAGFLRREFCSAFKCYAQREEREPQGRIAQSIAGLIGNIGKA